MQERTTEATPDPLPHRREHEFLSHLLVQGATEHAIFMTDPTGVILTWNPGVGRVLGYPEEAWIGRRAGILFTPEDNARRECEKEMERAARDGRAEDVRWHVRRDGSRFFADGVVTPLYGANGALVGFGKVVRDATERHRLETAVAEAAARLRLLTDAFPALIAYIGADGRYRFGNRTYAEWMGIDPEAMVGMHAREVLGDETYALREPYLRAVLRGESVRFESPLRLCDGRVLQTETLYVPDHTPAPAEPGRSPAPNDARPVRGLFVLVQDITERRRAEEALRAAHAQTVTILESISDAFYAVDADFRFTYINRRAEELWGRPRETLIGRGYWDEFPQAVGSRSYQMHRQAAQERRPLRYEAVSPIVGVPVEVNIYPTDDGGLSVYFRDIRERKELEAERERLLADLGGREREARERAEHERRINEVGAAIRGAGDDPEAIQRAAIAALGGALGADRCYYVTYDQAHDRARLGPEWLREKLSPIAGEYRMSDLLVNRAADYRRGGTQVVEDVHAFADAPADKADGGRDTGLMDALGLRSLIRVPLHPGEVMTALVAAMADAPRRWTHDEVRLVEVIAAQTRAAVETARAQARERNIARQLQAALQPPPPDDLPGLALEGFYRPALAEAGVGGDFFDVFTVERGCTALCVADLSGKGLAAASEVATVRNMTRYALYSSPTIADAVRGVDRILAEHDLLTGFATLFVGTYDHGDRTLTYVNCGQEPGLIWRAATGAVEFLEPTGPVLGGFDSGDEYDEVTVPLASGDVLALFTDGLTEVGPTRRSLLGVEGVARLLAERASAARATGAGPRAVVAGLMAAVEAYGRGGVRDDIALLLGIVRDDGAGC